MTSAFGTLNLSDYQFPDAMPASPSGSTDSSERHSLRRTPSSKHGSKHRAKHGEDRSSPSASHRGSIGDSVRSEGFSKLCFVYTLYVFRIRSLTSSPTRSENVILQRQHTRAVAPKTIIRAGPTIRRSRYGENRLGRSIRQRACNWIVPERKSSVCSTELSGVIFSSFRVDIHCLLMLTFRRTTTTKSRARRETVARDKATLFHRNGQASTVPQAVWLVHQAADPNIRNVLPAAGAHFKISTPAFQLTRA